MFGIRAFVSVGHGAKWFEVLKCVAIRGSQIRLCIGCQDLCFVLCHVVIINFASSGVKI